jgi:hypothetical protein
MPNMSYVQFKNTLEDLNLCHIALQEGVHRRPDFSAPEKKALEEMMDLCRQIVDEFASEVFS